MYKVKIFRDTNEYNLEDYVNNFLSSHKYGVVDIKYQMSVTSHADVYSAMIIYHESNKE